jgi:hypothetical protein
MIGTKADFSQNDPRWANTMLGFSSWEKIGLYGCLVTAFANVAQAQGTDLDPNSANQALKDKGLYVIDSYNQIADIRGYAALQQIAPHSQFVEQVNWPGDKLAPYSYFDVRSSTDTEIIIKLDYHPERAGVQDHYCRVVGLNAAQNDIEIVDSWDGKRKWLSSIAKIGNKQANQIIWTAGKYKRI